MPAVKKDKPPKGARKKPTAKRTSATTKAARQGTGAAAAAAVDAYLAAVPPAQRAALQRLREIIKSAAPDAEEAISYRIPLYKHHGHLVGFAAFKNHCTFFVTSTSLLRKYAAELKGFTTAPSGIHFTPDNPLPAALVRKIVKERKAENEKRRR